MNAKVFRPLALLLPFVGSAHAAIIQYNDLASFNTALTGGTTTLETFDTEAPGPLTPGIERAFEGFGFSFVNSPGGDQQAGIATPAQVEEPSRAYGTAINSTNSVAWGEGLYGGSGSGDGPDVTFRFFSPITAFGFDFSDSDPTDSYSVQFDNETPFQLGPGGGSSQFVSFFGFVSDTSFSTILFSQTATGGYTEAFSIDNIVTNGFATQEEADDAAGVPAPAPLSLMALALIALMTRRKKA